jgi:hypothetical protein
MPLLLHHQNKIILVYWIDQELAPLVVVRAWCFLVFPTTMNQQPLMHHEE